jgi:AcrR family transcriptional regulator
MAMRMSRAARVETNRGEVLAAARRVFLERGYAGSTLEAIAEAAGFTKGVVYSQFGGKADLLLALLEQRIEERAAQNEAIAARQPGLDGIRSLLRAGRRDAEAEAGWGLLLLEFRLHAARDAGLNARYAEAHRRAIAGIAHLLARLYREAGLTPPAPARQLATLLLAFGSGFLLERAADSRAVPQATAEAAIARALGIPGEPPAPP